MAKEFEINLQHGWLTWDATTSSWQLSWVHQVGTERTEHRASVGGAETDDIAALARLVGRHIPRNLGPITGIIRTAGQRRGWIEVVGSQIDRTFEG